MQNLLHDNVTLHQLTMILQNSPPQSILSPLNAPQWLALRTNPILQPTLQQLRSQALIEATQPLPPLTEELYTDFPRTGTRVRFESVYFDRRRQLARAAIAALTESDPATQNLLFASL